MSLFKKLFGSKKEATRVIIVSPQEESIQSKTEGSMESELKNGSVTDIAGKEYKTVQIGDQEWTAENLNVEHYRNGDIIPEVKDAGEWSNLETGAWCYYENDSTKGKTYGKLYNWYAVNDPRGLAPEGFHIPSDAEWTALTDFLGEVTKTGKTDSELEYWYIEEVGGKLKAKTMWDSPNIGATNATGFTAFPGGYRYNSGEFYDIGRDGNFWSASAYNNVDAWYRNLDYDYSDVYRYGYSKGSGFSVRCVRD